jgi:hypothetical protein
MNRESTLLGILAAGMILHLPRALVFGLIVLAMVASHFEPKGGKHR